jgi:hypothetical protein
VLIRVETKIFLFVFSLKFREKFFRFSRKKLTKSCENCRENFRENFRFRERFRENFRFCKSFRENFPFGMRIRIQEPLECVSRSENWSMLPKIFAKTIPGTKFFRENENFRENEIFRENENFRESKNFRETKFREKCANFRLFSLLAKMKKGVFVSTLVLMIIRFRTWILFGVIFVHCQ